MSLSCECWVLSGRGVCNGTNPGLKESYRVPVSLSVIRCNNNLLFLQRVGRRGQNKKERKEKRKIYYGVYSTSVPGKYYRRIVFHLCLVLLSSLLLSDFPAITLLYPLFLYAILLIFIWKVKKRNIYNDLWFVLYMNPCPLSPGSWVEIPHLFISFYFHCTTHTPNHYCHLFLQFFLTSLKTFLVFSLYSHLPPTTVVFHWFYHPICKQCETRGFQFYLRYICTVQYFPLALMYSII
jgi:hypothetical protein